MLQKFSVTNFKNFQEELTLDLTASNYAFNAEAVENRTIKNAIIYGYNGSGKSNIVRAIMDLTAHLTDYQLNKEAYRPYTCLNSEIDYASFCYEFNFDGDVLRYRYKKKDIMTIFDEEVSINEQLIIDSTMKIVNLSGAETLNLAFDSSISFVRYILRNTVLDETSKDVQLIKKFDSFVQRMLSFNSLEGNSYQGFKSGVDNLADIILNANKLTEFQKFLEAAGIHYQLAARVIDERKKIVAVYPNGKEIDLFLIASKGTKALILFYTWLIQFKNISLVLMDEFDSYYHTQLTKFILEKVIESDVQSIASSHNTSVMTNDLLRPDCYFVLENNKILSLDKTTNKELRKAHNIEKMYKAGAFKTNG